MLPAFQITGGFEVLEDGSWEARADNGSQLRGVPVERVSTDNLTQYSQLLRQIRALDPPHVQAPTSCNERDGTLLIVSRPTALRPIRDALADCETSVRNEAVLGFWQALSTLHASGLTHGTLRADHLLASHSQVRLVDFQLAHPFLNQLLGRSRAPSQANDVADLGDALFEALAAIQHSREPSGPKPRCFAELAGVIGGGLGAALDDALAAQPALGAADIRARLIRAASPPEAHPDLSAASCFVDTLVGRNAEMDRMREVFDTASKDGSRQIVELIGETGTGRSRMLATIETMARDHGWITRTFDAAVLPEPPAGRLWASDKTLVTVDNLDRATAQWMEWVTQQSNEAKEGPGVLVVSSNSAMLLPGGRVIELGPLSITQTHLLLVPALAGAHNPERLARALHRGSGGRPGWMHILWGAWTAAGHISAVNGRVYFDGLAGRTAAAESSIDAAVREALTEAPAPVQRALGTLALCRQPVSLEALVSCAPGTRAALTHPATAGLLRWAIGDGTVGFASEEASRAVEGWLDPTRRRQAAEQLLAAVDRFGLGAAKGRLLLEAGKLDEALRCLDQRFRTLVQAGDLWEALACARSWIDPLFLDAQSVDHATLEPGATTHRLLAAAEVAAKLGERQWVKSVNDRLDTWLQKAALESDAPRAGSAKGRFECDILIRRAAIATDCGNRQQAANHLGKAAGLRPSAADQLRIAVEEARLARTNQGPDSALQALATLDAALDAAPDAPRALRAKAWIAKGNQLLRLRQRQAGCLDQARQAFERGNDDAQAGGEQALQTVALHNLAIVDRNLGDYDAALASLDRARVIAQHWKLHPKQAFFAAAMRDQLCERLQFQKAESYCALALMIRKRLGLEAHAVATTAVLASTGIYSGKAKRAAEILEDLLTSHPQHQERGLWIANLGNAYAALGRSIDAEAALYSALAEPNFEPWAGFAHLGLGRLYAAQGRTAEALAALGQASEQLERASVLDEHKARSLLAVVHAADGSDAAAAGTLRQKPPHSMCERPPGATANALWWRFAQAACEPRASRLAALGAFFEQVRRSEAINDVLLCSRLASRIAAHLEVPSVVLKSWLHKLEMLAAELCQATDTPQQATVLIRELRTNLGQQDAKAAVQRGAEHQIIDERLDLEQKTGDRQLDVLAEENQRLKLELASLRGNGLAEGIGAQGVLRTLSAACAKRQPSLIVAPPGCGSERLVLALHRQIQPSGRVQAVFCDSEPAWLGRSGNTLLAETDLSDGDLILCRDADGVPAKVWALLRHRTGGKGVWVVATTREPLDAELFGGCQVHLSTLTERAEFLRTIVALLLKEMAPERCLAVPEAFIARCQSYHWPWNFDELRDAVRVALRTTNGDVLNHEHLPRSLHFGPYKKLLQEFERQKLSQVLAAFTGNAPLAAAHLELPESSLRYKLRRLGLRPADFST